MTKLMSGFTTTIFPRVKFLGHVKSEWGVGGTLIGLAPKMGVSLVVTWRGFEHGQVTTRASALDVFPRQHPSRIKGLLVLGRLLTLDSNRGQTINHHTSILTVTTTWCVVNNACTITCHGPRCVKWLNNIQNLVVNPPGSTNLSHSSICYVQFCQ